MPIHCNLVFQEVTLFRSVSDTHNVDIVKFHPSLSPVTVGHDVMAPDFPARVLLMPRWHSPMKERVESGHSDSRGGGLHMLKESGKAT